MLNNKSILLIKLQLFINFRTRKGSSGIQHRYTCFICIQRINNLQHTIMHAACRFYKAVDVAIFATRRRLIYCITWVNYRWPINNFNILSIVAGLLNELYKIAAMVKVNLTIQLFAAKHKWWLFGIPSHLKREGRATYKATLQIPIRNYPVSRNLQHTSINIYEVWVLLECIWRYKEQIEN